MKGLKEKYYMCRCDPVLQITFPYISIQCRHKSSTKIRIFSLLLKRLCAVNDCFWWKTVIISQWADAEMYYCCTSAKADLNPVCQLIFPFFFSFVVHLISSDQKKNHCEELKCLHWAEQGNDLSNDPKQGLDVDLGLLPSLHIFLLLPLHLLLFHSLP